MKAVVLFVGLLFIAWGIPAQAHGGGGGGHGGGGGGHSGGGGGHGGGHSGGHFGSHFGHGFHFFGHRGSKVGFRNGWRSPSSFKVVSPRITDFVGFATLPGLRFGFVSESFLCPFAPHLVSPFCPVCAFPGPFGFRHGFFGFAAFDDGGFWPFFDFGDGSMPLVGTPPPTASSTGKLPVLVLTNGWSFEVTDYWIDDEGELRYTTSYGGVNIVSLESLDLYATAKTNMERGIPFTLKVRHQP